MKGVRANLDMPYVLPQEKQYCPVESIISKAYLISSHFSVFLSFIKLTLKGSWMGVLKVRSPQQTQSIWRVWNLLLSYWVWLVRDLSLRTKTAFPDLCIPLQECKVHCSFLLLRVLVTLFSACSHCINFSLVYVGHWKFFKGIWMSRFERNYDVNKFALLVYNTIITFS